MASSHRALLLHGRKLARSAFKALSKKQQVELQSGTESRLARKGAMALAVTLNFAISRASVLVKAISHQ